MKIEIRDISQVEKEMKLIVEPEVATKDYNGILNRVRNHISIPGFRKGKSPLSMIERNYADYIKEEFYNQKLGEYYKAALDQENINPVNQGEATDVKWEKGKELEATFKFEIMPEIKVEKYKDLEIPFEELKFKKEMVLETLEDFRKKMAVEIDAETAEKGDKLSLTINFLKDENGEIPKSIEREIILGNNQYSADFDKNLTGKKVNDEVKTKLFTPEQETEEEDFTGDIKNKNFLVKINTIKRAELPELNDEFAKDLEYDSFESMKNKVEEDLKVKIKTENKNRLKDAILSRLIEENPFELPSTLIRKYAENLAKPYADAYKISMDQIIAYYEKIAEFNMKSHYILEELKKIENIEITDDDIEATINKAAANMDMELEKYKKMYKKQINSEDFKYAIAERKLLDLIENSSNFVPYPQENDLKEEKVK
ncbi:MAG: hypothetical protein APR54_04845 [Candidatus Cloacimonas sp. SDB]|nr:MAG: hypothetical protein APR54_04845 [Candidatus Cloacimonas sp. SDB]